MFHQKIDPADAEKLMPEFLQQAIAQQPHADVEEPGVLRLLRELSQTTLFDTYT